MYHMLAGPLANFFFMRIVSRLLYVCNEIERRDASDQLAASRETSSS
jgi:hypothetical protein